MARNRLAAVSDSNNTNDPDYYEDLYDSYGQPAAPAYRPPVNPARRQGPLRNGLPIGPGRRLSRADSYDDEKPSYAQPPPPSSRRQPDYDRNEMEMRPVSTRQQYSNGDSKGPREVSSTEEFFDAIANLQVDLKELQHIITEMSDLSKRSIDPSSDSDRETLQDEIGQLGDDIRALSAQLKLAIQSFEADHSLLRQRGDPEGNLSVRCDQLAALKKRFVETVQRYAEVEQAARRTMKSRIERQVRIVKPDASAEEVRIAVEDQINGGGAVFQQALASSNRMGSARSALREVQSRAEEIKRIEQTISELAEMFNDMATMVEEQDVQVQHIEKQAETAHQDIESATNELKTAVVSAKGARSKRKWCFMLIVIIVLVLGGGATVYALFKTGVIGGDSKRPANASSSNSTTTPSISNTSSTPTTSSTTLGSLTSSRVPSS